MMSHGEIYAVLKKYYGARLVETHLFNTKRYRIPKGNRLFDLLVKHAQTVHDETRMFTLHLEERVIPEAENGKVRYRDLDMIEGVTSMIELRKWVNTQLIRAIMEKGL